MLILFLILATVFSQNVFNVQDYGAKGDGDHDDTKAIQSTFNACEKGGGGTVFFPDGEYRAFPLKLISNVIVEFESEDAGIKYFDDIDNWPKKDDEYLSCINGDGVSNVTIKNGFLDGNGKRWWNDHADDRPRGLVVICDCKDITLRNMKLKDSPAFHFIPDSCQNVEVDSCQFEAPDDSPNTDGIDPVEVTNMWVHDTEINVGDDCVAIKRNSKNILVENCYFGRGHGASVGSLSDDEFARNITFRNIEMKNTARGVRIKTRKGWNDITYQDFTISGVVKQVLSLDMFYGQSDSDRESSTKRKVGERTTGKGKGIHGVTYKNIKATDSGRAGIFHCTDDLPCHDITMENVHVKADKEKEFSCKNAYGHSEDVSPDSCIKELFLYRTIIL